MFGRRDPSDLAAEAAQELEDRFAKNEARINRIEWMIGIVAIGFIFLVFAK